MAAGLSVDPEVWRREFDELMLLASMIQGADEVRY
jgi:hypothetical protein